MQHVNAIQAAIKATAPIVAIPVEGQKPLCICRKLLAGALKGVTITSVEISRSYYTDYPHAVLIVKGHAGIAYPSAVKTSFKIRAIDHEKAMQEIGEWRDKEIEKRRRITMQGVLSAPEQRAMKLAKAAQAGIAELIQAQKVEAEILAEAKEHAKQEMRAIRPEDRADLMESYLAFRRGNRKVGSVILFKMGKLQKELDALTEKRTVQRRGYGRHRGPIDRINRVRKPKNVVLVADLMAQIGALKAEFQVLYPPVWVAPNSAYEWDRGRWKDTFVKQRPKGGWKERQAWYSTADSWRWGHEDRYDRKVMARRLRDARADIRALTPPETEEDFAIAA